MSTLSDCEFCLEKQKQNGTYRESEIVVVIKSDGVYQKGDFAIVTEWYDGRCTIEKPMSKEQIADQESRGSLITTVATTINFPAARLAPLTREALAKAPLGGGETR